jgi:hypothetical protein
MRMNFQPLLACGPSGSLVVMLLGALGGGALSFISGIVCLCFGSRSLGVFLVAAPITIFGALYLLAVH